MSSRRFPISASSKSSVYISRTIYSRDFPAPQPRLNHYELFASCHHHWRDTSQLLHAAGRGRRIAGARNPLLHFLFSFGLFGVFLVSIVDSSFVPLPLPGITDIMIIVLAAQHQSWFLLILLATAGSALGGYFSYQVGQSGGMAFLEKRVPARIFKRVCEWMENHAILSVALPAILPPPMPLSPFVLAAGALKMSRKKFLTTFTISRCLRHSIAAWLGIHYGRHILRLWNSLSAKYATPVLIVIWTVIAVSCAYRLLEALQDLAQPSASGLRQPRRPPQPDRLAYAASLRPRSKLPLVVGRGQRNRRHSNHRRPQPHIPRDCRRTASASPPRRPSTPQCSCQSCSPGACTTRTSSPSASAQTTTSAAPKPASR